MILFIYNQKEGTPYVIFSWGVEDPKFAGQDIFYHYENKGSMALNILSGWNKSEEINSYNETIEFGISNVLIPKLENFYYCKVFKVPLSYLLEKRHIYKVHISK